MDKFKAIKQAVEKAGGIAPLIRELNARGHGIKGHAVIQQWVKNGTPADYCPDIEAITGIRCELLRPETNWSFVRASGAAVAARQVNDPIAKND